MTIINIGSEDVLELDVSLDLVNTVDFKKWASDTGILLGEGTSTDAKQDDMIFIKCPWSAEHTSKTGDKDSAIILPKTGGAIYKCFHGHCEGRTVNDIINKIGEASFTTYIDEAKVNAIEVDMSSLTSTTNYATPKVRPIGFFNSTLDFYCEDSNQFLEVSSSDINISMLCSDQNWWESYCPDAFIYSKKTGEIVKIDNNKIKDKLIADAKATNNRIEFVERRETGVYKDDGRIIANLGNKLYIDGVEAQYYETKSSALYQASGVIPTSDVPSTPSEFLDIIDLFNNTTIAKSKSNSWVLLSTICSGYLSGLSPWRAMLWIVGLPATGKSTIKRYIHNLIKAIGGEAKDGALTEAAIRQLIQRRRTIFLHDEAEHSPYMPNEINLIRLCASGGSVSKGTPNGRPLIFQAYSSFILMSISDSLDKIADESRFIKITLGQTDTSSEKWVETEKRLDELMTPELGARYCKRMIANANNYLLLIPFIKNIIKEYLTNIGAIRDMISRYTDLYSPILAAYFIMSHPEHSTITKAQVEQKLKELHDDGKFDAIISDTTESGTILPEQLFEHLLDTHINIKGIKVSIRTMLNTRTTDYSYKDLRSYGIYYIPDQNVLRLRSNRYLKGIFEEAGYHNYRNILKEYPGASVPKEAKITDGERYRCVELPYTNLIKDETEVVDCQLPNLTI